MWVGYAYLMSSLASRFQPSPAFNILFQILKSLVYIEKEFYALIQSNRERTYFSTSLLIAGFGSFPHFELR